MGTLIGPYGESGALYASCGWKAPIPVDINGETGKVLPGFTGEARRDPTPNQIRELVKDYPDHNIGLVLPRNMVGFDVDHYGKKTGADDIAQLEIKLGALPKGPLSTARNFGLSGIRFFRVPDDFDTSNLGDVGADVDLIRFGWRWARVWPSKHDKSDAQYQWYGSSGHPLTTPPRPSDFPMLPKTWLDWLKSREKPSKSEAVELPDPEPFELTDHAWLTDIFESDKEKVAGGESRYLTSVHLAYRAAEKGLTRAQTHYALTLHEPTRAKIIEEGGSVHAHSAKSYLEKTINEAFEKHQHEGQTCEVVNCEHKPTTTQVIRLTKDAEDEFWNSRTELKHILDTARARLASPWATLGEVLIRAIALTPPTLRLPPLTGKDGSLNNFLAVVGEPGMGKGVSDGTAESAFIWPEVVDTRRPGSGQGLAHLFVSRGSKTKEDPNPEQVRHNDRALLSLSEIETLAALTNQQSSTLLPELRAVWSGEVLGSKNAETTRDLHVASHSYRLCLSVGVQPSKAGTLLDGADGGTPQRFLWMPADDPNASRERLIPPPPMTLTLPHKDPNPLGGIRPQDINPVRIMSVPNVVVDASWEDRVRTLRREKKAEDVLDNHALLMREKVAASLAILNGRADMNEEDWELAGTIMQVSNATRQQVIDKVAKEHRQQNISRGKADGYKRVASDSVVDKEQTKRASDTMKRKLEKTPGEWVSGGDLRRALGRPEIRKYYDQGMEHLEISLGTKLESKKVENRNGAIGMHYRLIAG